MNTLRKGDRVVLTDAGLKNGLDGKHMRRTGIVTTGERNGLVNVHRVGDADGKNGLYSVNYWKKSESELEPIENPS